MIFCTKIVHMNETIIEATIIFSILSDQIYCDGLVCPANSVSCTVYRVTTADLSKIEITKQCLDSTGK